MNYNSRKVKSEYFDSLADGWDERVGNNAERAEMLKDLFGMIRLGQGQKVLDVGCGNGILFRFIEEVIGDGGKITAIDSSPGMIGKARDIHARFENIEYCAGFIEELELPDQSFDVVFCYAVLPHIDDIPSALGRIYSLLKDGGILYIFHPASTSDLNRFHSELNAPVKHDMLPEEEEIKRILSIAGFSVDRYIDEPGLNFLECSK